MKQIGKEVLFLKPGIGCSRITEGDFIKLKSGRILFAYTHFVGDDSGDNASARIDGVFSDDEGETWSEPYNMVVPVENARNIMSVSFLHMNDGSIGIFYLRKFGIKTCVPFLRRSYDDGVTWSEPLRCVKDDGYYVLNNSRVVRLKSGRIILPMAKHHLESFEKWYDEPSGAVFAYSDNEGRTWHITEKPVYLKEHDSTGLQEPGIVELKGKIWCYIRTARLCQYMMFSEDDGITWSDPEPDIRFSSPVSPMTVKRLSDGALVAVFNPIPNYTGRSTGSTWGRTPLAVAVSKDDGKTFSLLGLLEDDEKYGYCYPAVYAGDGYFLTAYCSGRGGAMPLYATCIRKTILNPSYTNHDYKTSKKSSENL